MWNKADCVSVVEFAPLRCVLLNVMCKAERLFPHLFVSLLKSAEFPYHKYP